MNSAFVAQEQVIQIFKTHKKFIEKEITAAINKMALLKKENRPEKVLCGFKEHVQHLQNLRQKYSELLQ
jgi:hypothetical protein